MKLIFFGTSNVALPVLEALSRKHEIAAVVTMPDSKVGRSQTLTESPVSVLAKEMKLQIIKPEKVKGNEEFYHTLQNLVSPPPSLPPSSSAEATADRQEGGKDGGAELFVVVSYGQILPLEIINLPKFKTINVHFSLLPKYRGSSPIQTALLNGETHTGTSIFILDEQVDHGPLLVQEKIAIDSDDNSITLSEKMAYKSAQLIIPTIESYASGSLISKPQDDSQATHTEHIDKAHGRINWSQSSQQIYNQFRAFYPWPGVWTTWNGKLVKIIDCSPANFQNASESTPTLASQGRSPDQSVGADSFRTGQVLEGGVVVCGESSVLQIKTLQLEGKKEIDILSFLNGYGGFVGSVLG